MAAGFAGLLDFAGYPVGGGVPAPAPPSDGGAGYAHDPHAVYAHALARLHRIARDDDDALAAVLALG